MFEKKEPHLMWDLFLLAAEPSADIYGAELLRELLRLYPHLNIAAVAGPRMRQFPISALFQMENLQVMGFIDVFIALPRIIKQFFAIRRTILDLNPKAVVCIDYPGFNLFLERSLRKKGYKGRLIHYICPTVWAWGKKRIPRMAETLDLLLVFFPFEIKCFAGTALRVEYVGHPLISQIPSSPSKPKQRQTLALFPGSREMEIRRNFPLQLAAARRLAARDLTLEIAVSVAQSGQESLLRSLIQEKNCRIHFYTNTQNYELMKEARAAIATSGTITLELALHQVPTVVNFAIRPLDLFVAQRILSIRLPFYCIVNIILSKMVFPELFGPHLTPKNLDVAIQHLWFDEKTRSNIAADCALLRKALGEREASREAACTIGTLAF